MNKLYTLLCVLFLSGCATSEVSQINYYLLDQARHQNVIAESGDTPTHVLADIYLANYLKKSNLPLQLNGHQLYYSTEHVWAEPLSASIGRALIQDLNGTGNNFYLVSSDHPNVKNINRKIVVQFDHFVATDDSTAIISGKYWLQNTDDPKETKERQFNMETSLDEDGFPHAVSKLRSLVARLSKQIEQDIGNQ